MKKFCSECGNRLEGGAKFCSGCGKPVSGASVASAIETDRPGRAHQPAQKNGVTVTPFGSILIVLVMAALVWIFFQIGRSHITTSAPMTRVTAGNMPDRSGSNP